MAFRKVNQPLPCHRAVPFRLLDPQGACRPLLRKDELLCTGEKPVAALLFLLLTACKRGCAAHGISFWTADSGLILQCRRYSQYTSSGSSAASSHRRGVVLLVGALATIVR